MTARRTEKQRDKRGFWRKGYFAEEFCRFYLLLHGYRILAHRYKTRLGEIDLIARRGGQIAFIEVKARKTSRDGGEAVQEKSMRRIDNAAKIFLAAHPKHDNCDMRFDVMVVTSFLKRPDWYKNAWQSR
jgi:putative endonuclease